MIVLGIESSSVQTSVALGSEQETISSARVTRGSTAEEFILPAVDFMLSSAGVKWENIAGVAVGLGPGRYTSMRIGVTTAKTLSQALSVPIVGTPSLDVLAFDLRHADKIICIVLDARRDEVFFGFYRPVPGGIVREGDHMVGTVRRLLAELEARGEDALVAGAGALHFRDELHDVGLVEVGSVDNAFPRASSLVELAQQRFLREDYDSLFALEPLYMRRVDAKINWQVRAG